MPSQAAVSKNSVARKIASQPAIKVLAKKAGVAKPGVKASAITSRPASQGSKSTAAAMLSEAERHQQVSDAAYYLAEKRGFNGGDELADWFAAEQEIAARHKS